MPGFEQYDSFFWLLMITAIIGGVLKAAWSGWETYQTVRNFHQVFHAYNEAMHQHYLQLGMAVLAHQQQAAQVAEQELRRQIAQIPLRERRAHEAHLSDIVSHRLTLNPKTGEFEEQ